jgi:antirestriction protein
MLDQDGTFERVESIGLNRSYVDLKQIATDWFIDSYLSIEKGYNEVYVFIRH